MHRTLKKLKVRVFGGAITSQCSITSTTHTNTQLQSPQLPNLPTMKRPTETITITSKVLEQLRANPQVRLDVSTVNWQVRRELDPLILALFPHAFRLNIGKNMITSLDGLLHDNKPVMPYLISIDCPDNEITTYPLRFQYLLTYLNIENCNVKTLEGLEGCTRLTVLKVSGNPIQNYRALLYLPTLYRFEHTATNQDMWFQPKIVRRIMAAPWSVPRRSNHGMHDQEFQDSADLALTKLVQGIDGVQPTVSFLEADKEGNFHDYGLTEGAAMTLFKLCEDKTVHPKFGTFEHLMDCIWQRVLSKEASKDDEESPFYSICPELSRYATDAKHMDIEHLFRYMVLAISSFFSDLAITFSPEAKINQEIADIEKKNPDASIRKKSVWPS